MKRLLFFIITFVSVSEAISQIRYSVAVDGIAYGLDPVNMTAVVAGSGSYFYKDKYEQIYIDYNEKDRIDIPVSVRIGKNAIYTSVNTSHYVPAGNYRVTKIGKEVFRDCTNIKSVSIPNSITSLEMGAFYGCSGLKTINIPNSVTSIGRECFECTGLETILIPDGVEGLNEAVFKNCSNLHTINILGEIKYIGVGAFRGCSNLQSIIIPCSVDSIGYAAFRESGLKTIEVPSSTKVLGGDVFFGCENLESAILPDNIKIGYQSFSQCIHLRKIRLGENIVFDDLGYTFNRCISLDSVLIPKGAVVKGRGIFSECENLVYVCIEDGVQELGEMSFLNCINLKDVYVFGELPIEGNDNIFYCTEYYLKERGLEMEDENYIYEHAELHVPKFRGFDYRLVSPWKNFRTVTDDIGKDSGGESDKDTIIQFADSKTKEICLKYWDTDEDGKLSKTEAAAVLWIGNAFVESEITSFNEFSYFTAVTDIDDAAFRKCKNLQEITLPNSATSIGKQTFAYCQNLTKVVMSNSMSSLGDYAFMGCSGLASIELTDNLTKIGVGAFENCSALSTISIPASVFYIGGSPFDTCSGLTSINVDNDNMRYCSVDGVLFDKACTKIVQYPIGKKGSEYAIPATVTTIGEGAFISSANLHGITIPEGVMTIELGAFMDCTGLESITIPQSVESLAKYCFYGCSSLKSVTSMIVNPFEIESNVFETGNGIFTTATLYTPMGSASKYQSTGGWKNFKKFMPIGDVNGDNAINDTDVKEETSYIMGNPSKTFVKAAADMNGDGVINVADIVLMNAINSKK